MSEMMDIVKQVSENVAQHIEEFAAAFAKRTGLDPTKIKMVSSIRGYRHEVWFEPFPSITEIEQYRKRAELAEAELARLTAELEREKDNCGKFYLALEKIYDALGMDDHTGSCIPEIDRLTEQVARLKEDAERLAKLNCHCHDTRGMTFLDDNYHAPDCPITLHRALMKELE